MGKAFMAAKVALTDTTHLAHPIQDAELSLAVDASNHLVGAALQQQSPCGEWQLLSFFSRKLTYTETWFSTFDRELLMVVAALHHFWFLLEGRKFHMLTSHKLLVFAHHRAQDAWSTSQGSHLASWLSSPLTRATWQERIMWLSTAIFRPPEELSLSRST